MDRKPYTKEQLKKIATSFWNGYLEDKLSPLEAADSTISELLGSSRITHGQWSIIYATISELYAESPNHDAGYCQKLSLQAEELKQRYPD